MNNTRDWHWFLNTLVRIHVSGDDGSDRISYIEHIVRQGESPPLHIHEREDEIFHLLEGEFKFRLRGDEFTCGPGEVVFIPKGAPHTFLSLSPAGGRFFSATTGEDFERFMRGLWRIAERAELPTPGAPTPEAIEALGKAAAAHHMPVVGPPLN
ncbi:MAG: cupin domain-containing protein [Flavobacteriales bacterium]|nr:cupin domain-containing protein [Flavobacteriales bacterium]